MEAAAGHARAIRPPARRAIPDGGPRSAATRVTRIRVALLATCLVDTLFPDVGRATVRLLERLGVDVDFPSGQACCGQMHVNAGYPEQALAIIRNHVAAFSGAELVVAPSGSCVGAVRHQQARVARQAGDLALARDAEALAARTLELTELLVDVLAIEDVGARFPHRVTYHPTCHALRLLRVGDRPRRLLSRVRGLELVELGDAEVCCGFGGTFSVANPDVSAAMLGDKLSRVLATGAEVVTAVDVSCLMHIAGGLSRLRTGVRAMHLAEILATTGDGP